MIGIFIHLSRLVISFTVWFINVVLKIKFDVQKINSFQITFYGDGYSTLFEGLTSSFFVSFYHWFRNSAKNSKTVTPIEIYVIFVCY